jgi:uncharacterized protein YwqG
MLSLPPELEPFREKIVQTSCPFIRAKAQASRNTALWDSKLGGLPYIPKGFDWPVSPEGIPLVFLQFFIFDDDLYGMDFDDGENPDTFRVLYHPEIITDEKQLATNYTPMQDYDLLPHHPDEVYPLVFSMEEEYLPLTDYAFSQRFGADFFQQFGEKEWDLTDQYGKAVRADGHKLGGYAYFTQDDPRRPDDPMLLLFQLDSDEKMDLMWGDMGVGHFFIREKDLLARNFSRVLYDWDCL